MFRSDVIFSVLLISASLFPWKAVIEVGFDVFS